MAFDKTDSTIYNSDGILMSDRVVNLNNKILSFRDGFSEFTFNRTAGPGSRPVTYLKRGFNQGIFDTTQSFLVMIIDHDYAATFIGVGSPNGGNDEQGGSDPGAIIAMQKDWIAETTNITLIADSVGFESDVYFQVTNTDNTATVLYGKDSNDKLVEVEVSSLNGSSPSTTQKVYDYNPNNNDILFAAKDCRQMVIGPYLTLSYLTIHLPLNPVDCQIFTITTLSGGFTIQLNVIDSTPSEIPGSWNGVTTPNAWGSFDNPVSVNDTRSWMYSYKENRWSPI